MSTCMRNVPFDDIQQQRDRWRWDGQILPPTALTKAVARANAKVEKVTKTLEILHYEVYDSFI